MLVQRTILDNIRELQVSQGFAVIFVSYDLGTVLETSATGSPSRPPLNRGPSGAPC